MKLSKRDILSKRAGELIQFPSKNPPAKKLLTVLRILMDQLENQEITDKDFAEHLLSLAKSFKKDVDETV